MHYNITRKGVQVRNYNRSQVSPPAHLTKENKVIVGVLVGDGIGNMIMTTPLISWLKKSGHEVHIIAMPAKKGTENILDNKTYVDKIHYIGEYSFGSRTKVRKKYDLSQTGIQVIIETFHVKISYIMDKVILPAHRVISFPFSVYGNDKIRVYQMNEYLLNLRQGRSYAKVSEDRRVTFVTDSKSKMEFSSYDFVIHAGSIQKGHVSWLNRKWDKYSDLIDTLINRNPDCRIALIGSNADVISNDIKSIRSVNVDNYINKLTISDLLELFRNCSLFIGNDGGCMHMAAAVGIPVIGLFGLSLPEKNLPITFPSVGLISSNQCVGCVADRNKRQICQDNKCMKDIKVEHILYAIDLIKRDKLFNGRLCISDINITSRKSYSSCGVKIIKERE